MLSRVVLIFLPLLAAAASDHYVFTSFRGNGESGVFLATSEDGLHWTPVYGNRPVIPPQFPGMLMRDPYLVQGPDKLWHLLWTTGWTRPQPGAPLTLGHATSKDLVNWFTQQQIEIDLPGARNLWAPEMVWDAKAKQWLIFWASTIPGRFPDGDSTGDGGYNHRIYAITTRSFRTFSAPRLLFDPGFNSIDSTMIKDGKRWIMIFKDERKTPLQKKLRLAFAESPGGPWTGVTEPFTKDWVEGPSALSTSQGWLIFFDHYAKPHYYGAYRTRDWQHFEDVTSQTSFPEDHRHGTAARISEREYKSLRALP